MTGKDVSSVFHSTLTCFQKLGATPVVIYCVQFNQLPSLQHLERDIIFFFLLEDAPDLGLIIHKHPCSMFFKS